MKNHPPPNQLVVDIKCLLGDIHYIKEKIYLKLTNYIKVLFISVVEEVFRSFT